MAAPCSIGGSFPVLSVTDAWLIPAGDTPYVGFPTQLIQWSKGPTGQCPLWVISGYLHCNGSCPLYPPKADMCCATRDVCFGPIADIAHFIRSHRWRGQGLNLESSSRFSSRY